MPPPATLADRHKAFLLDLETVVVRVDHLSRLESDRPVMRAFEVLAQNYRGRQQAGPPLLPTEMELVRELMRVCELWRQERSLDPADLVACLRRLVKSAERWHSRGGVRGYIDYVRGFVSLD